MWCANQVEKPEFEILILYLGSNTDYSHCKYATISSARWKSNARFLNYSLTVRPYFLNKNL